LAEISDWHPDSSESGVMANQRLTALTGGLLVVLLALMGVTILSVRRLLPEHFALGFLLIPPVALKLASTGYRFVRYYTGDSRYRSAGPPQLFMRLMAPIVILSTVAVFATGIELWLFGLRFESIWVEAHKLSFIVWLPATAVHVLGHLSQTAQVAADEVSAPGSRSVITRRSLLVGSMIAGVVLAAASLSYATPFIFFRDG
jgi:hypothetical protein